MSAIHRKLQFDIWPNWSELSAAKISLLASAISGAKATYRAAARISQNSSHSDMNQSGRYGTVLRQPWRGTMSMTTNGRKTKRKERVMADSPLFEIAGDVLEVAKSEVPTPEINAEKEACMRAAEAYDNAQKAIAEAEA